MGTTGATAPTSPTAGFPTGQIQIPATTSTNSPVVGFSVDPTGAVTVTGQDGSNQTVGFIAVSQYSDNQALSDQGNGLYAYDPAAGTNEYYTGGSGSAATIQTGVLEASNVDLSTEFANMILAQTAFSANARVITVSDSILQTTTNLKTQ
jgi:flagellar hook protein FlgE